MAIFGIGAFFHGTTDVSKEFLKRGVACVGWPEQDAPALHKLLGRIQIGDIVYIKAHPPGRELIVKGVGIVTDDVIRDYGTLGRGLRVRWVWRRRKVLREAKAERYNVRDNTLYEELSPVIQKKILKLFLR